MQVDLTRQEEIIDQRQEIACPSGQPIELHHHHVPHFAPFASRHQLTERWPCCASRLTPSRACLISRDPAIT